MSVALGKVIRCTRMAIKRLSGKCAEESAHKSYDFYFPTGLRTEVYNPAELKSKFEHIEVVQMTIPGKSTLM